MDCHMPLSENALDEMVARERERGAPPLTDWDSLSVRLRDEGLIRDAVPARFNSQRWMQVAAGLVLAIGGAAAGRASAGASLLPSAASTVASTDVFTEVKSWPNGVLRSSAVGLTELHVAGGCGMASPETAA